MSRIQVVELFAMAKDLAGCPHVEVSVPASMDAAHLKQLIAEQHPSLEPILPSCRLAIDDRYATEDQIIDANSSVSLIPPVSGG